MYDRIRMDTVTLTVDGRQIEVEKDKTVLQAAIENDIRTPYDCYHPGISIDGSCRVCIVKIEKMPKLQTSCSTHLHERCAYPVGYRRALRERIEPRADYDARLRAADTGAELAPRLESVRALEVGFGVPGFAALEGRRRSLGCSDGIHAGGRHPGQESGLTGPI